MKSRYDRFFKEIKQKVKISNEIFIKLREIKHENSLDKGLQEVVNSLFYNDVWHSENLPNVKNGKDIEVLPFNYGNKRKLVTFLKKQKFDHNDIPRLVKKLSNLKNTVEIIQITKIPPITLDFIKDIHKIIMKDLLDNRGEIRQTIVKPLGSDNYYVLPQFINIKLNRLINFVNKELEKNPNQTDKVLLGCLFFSEFLLIHPFSNGNGRLARILLSMFISPPIPITFDSCSGNQYLSVLEDRLNHIESSPIKLIKYIINAINISVANIHYLTVDKI